MHFFHEKFRYKRPTLIHFSLCLLSLVAFKQNMHAAVVCILFHVVSYKNILSYGEYCQNMSLPDPTESQDSPSRHSNL